MGRAVGFPLLLLIALLLLAPAGPALAQEGCVRGAAALCLQGDRFRVEVSWEDFAGQRGTGRAVPLTADTGYFWFFGESNVELMVKILDGRGLNQHFWVFYGALSSVRYEITVTDTATGASKKYTNPSGELASVADTAAFGPFPPAAASAGAVPESGALAGAPLFAPGGRLSLAKAGEPCASGPEVLCLGADRFQAVVYWRDFEGNIGRGRAVQLTPDTGYFWFFAPTNVELLTKVLDGRGVNSRFWTFYGALSSVEYLLQVTDTQTGAVQTYHNPSGRLASAADTDAFRDDVDPAVLGAALAGAAEVLTEEGRAELFPVSENMATTAAGALAQIGTIFSCLERAASGGTVACPAFDAATGNQMLVTVPPEQARWLASLVTPAADPPGGDPPGVPPGDPPAGAAKIDLPDFLTCPRDAHFVAASARNCNFLDPRSWAASATLEVSLWLVDWACIAAAATPVCLVWNSLELMVDVYSALICNFTPIDLQALRILPAGGLLLGPNQTRGFEVQGTFRNRGKVSSLVPLVTEVVARFLERRLVPRQVAVEILEPVVSTVVEQLVGATDLRLATDLTCRNVLPATLASARAEVTRGGGVSVSGQTLRSGAQTAEGRLEPRLLSASPWQLSDVPSDQRFAAPFTVGQDPRCPGSGSHRLETYRLPADALAPETLTTDRYTSIDCEGRRGSGYRQERIRNGYTPGGLLASLTGQKEVYKCDGRWIPVRIERTFPTCDAPGLVYEYCTEFWTLSSDFRDGKLVERSVTGGKAAFTYQGSSQAERQSSLIEGTFSVETGRFKTTGSGTYVYTHRPAGQTCATAYDTSNTFSGSGTYSVQPTCRMVTECPR